MPGGSRYRIDMMRPTPFIVASKDEERSELLRRLAAALEPKPLHDGKTLTANRSGTKSTEQE